MITAEEREDIFRDIWRGVTTVFALPLVLFSDTFNGLQKGLFRGFGGTLADFPENSADFKTLTRLNQNVNSFSAAKTFQFVKDSDNLILDTAGNLRPFTEFRTDVKKIYDVQYDNWLKTEFETTVAGAQSAVQWNDIQRDKKTLTLLKYQTAGDNRVRPLHAAWDGIVKPVDDPFWDTHNPPTDFNCFEPNTKILTPKGWKKISTIKKGDYIIGGSGEKRKVIGVHTNTFKGNLIKFESKNSFIMCTPNHRILTLKGWKRADSIKISDIIIQQTKAIIQNTPIRYIDKMNTFFSNIFVAFIIHWNSLSAKTFNSYLQFRNKYVNPIGRNIMIKNRIIPNRFNIINHCLFAFCWLYSGVYMFFREIFVHLFSRNSSFFDNLFSSKRGIDFKFFGSPFKWLISFFGFAKIMMRIFFIKLFHKFFCSFALILSSFGVVNPLRFYSFAPFPGANSKMFYQFNDSSDIHIPSFTKHPISKKLTNIKVINSFFSGAPLNIFNSLKDFIRYSFFHFKFIRLENITNIQYTGNINNLSVEKDETYITELGIVHNCRCIVIQLEEGEEKVTNLGDHLKKVKKETKGEVTSLENDSKIFNINPGKHKIIFPNAHPYFKVDKTHKILKANNFNLPLA